MKRIVIIGTSCSGKTTLAKQIQNQLQIKHIELDELHWKPSWVERENDEFKNLVAKEAVAENWVIDGNYSVVRDILWSRATAIIWLNYSFPLVLYRAVFRSLRRSLRKEVIFAGNVESFKRSFLSRESIIFWVIKTHSIKKEKYKKLLYSDVVKDKKIIELHSQAEADQFLQNLALRNK